MTTDHKENRRPRAGGRRSENGWRATSHDTGSAPVAAALERADHALVLVRGIKGGGTRRRVMFSLPSAQKAMEKAHALGYPASLHLVQLLPVGLVSLEDEVSADA